MGIRKKVKREATEEIEQQNKEKRGNEKQQKEYNYKIKKKGKREATEGIQLQNKGKRRNERQQNE